jgi:hypothetical protein
VAVGREDELAELIAFHYREAATLGETVGTPDPDARLRASSWLRRAAEVAAGARGMSEAVAHLRAAIELAPISDQPEIHRRMGELYGSGDRSVQAYAAAWGLGEELGRPPDFLLDNLAHQLMVTSRWFASVADQPSEQEINELITKGNGWLGDSGPQARATFLIAISNLPFWLRNAAIRPLTPTDLDDAIKAADEGLRIAEEIHDPILISAALDAMTSHTQTTQPAAARQLSMRRVSMGSQLSSDERLDALNMVAWSSALIGDLPQVLESSAAAMALIQPGQNAGFSVGCASWNAYAQALIGSWEPMVTTVDWLRARWFEAERPAASYGLQGPLSAIDWARNRGQDDLVERWGDVASEIIGQFASQHPVAALAGVLELDLDRVADIIARHARYPDRVHYVEHALAICADHAHPVPLNPIEEVLEAAVASGMRVVEAQGRRLRGMLRADPADLRESLRLFEEIGANRYAARVRSVLGRLTDDQELRRRGDHELDDLGEIDRLMRMALGPA